MAYGGSQARGLIRATAAGLPHSHSNAGSLAHWVRPGMEPATSWFPVRFVSTAQRRELVRPVQEHGVSFHLLVSSLISFISILQFSEYRSFVSLGFIPKCFILFNVMVNGIVPLISLADLSLLVYRYAVSFCVLILNPAALPNSWMSSHSFLVASFRIL